MRIADLSPTDALLSPTGSLLLAPGDTDGLILIAKPGTPTARFAAQAASLLR